jgi:cytochrome c biogenesis protein CcdA
MISNKLQEHIFDFTFVIIYVLYFLVALGLSATAPKYLAFLDYYVKIYVSLFLIWSFNPFNKRRKFTSLDRKIALNAGIFVLFATTSLNQIVIDYFKNMFML